ncbi:brain-specific serine protease 4-like [Littorina saxatilis]|uniref:Peptidase S1 domain-containing protein n=1 Tax=Littorina saxatilis TaxID=31220 RepID=A0AAN9BYB9_9CAEN
MEWCGVLLVVLLWGSTSSRTVDRRFLTQATEPRTVQCGTPSEPIGTSTSTSRKRVAGGNATTTASFPWTVMVKKYGHSDVRCGAAILSHRLVLTAAHCFDNLSKNEMYLLTGVDDMDGWNLQQKMYHVSDIVIHEDYDSTTMKNDIALLKTTTSFTFNSVAKPICLPGASFQMSPGDVCVFAGYGDTQGIPAGRDRKLNCMQVPLVNDSLCAQSDWLGADYVTVRDVSICAGYANGGADACSGDSGGALVCKQSGDQKYYIYGISSWGKGCGERQMPGVYTKVVSFLDWVKAKSESLS